MGCSVCRFFSHSYEQNLLLDHLNVDWLKWTMYKHFQPSPDRVNVCFKSKSQPLSLHNIFKDSKKKLYWNTFLSSSHFHLNNSSVFIDVALFCITSFISCLPLSTPRYLCCVQVIITATFSSAQEPVCWCRDFYLLRRNTHKIHKTLHQILSVPPCFWRLYLLFSSRFSC